METNMEMMEEMDMWSYAGSVYNSPCSHIGTHEITRRRLLHESPRVNMKHPEMSTNSANHLLCDCKMIQWNTNLNFGAMLVVDADISLQLSTK